MSSKQQDSHLEETGKRASLPSRATSNKASFSSQSGARSDAAPSSPTSSDDEGEIPTVPRLRANKPKTDVQQESASDAPPPGSDNWFTSQLPTGFLLEGAEDLPSELWLKLPDESNPKLTKQDRASSSVKPNNTSEQQLDEDQSAPTPKPLIDPSIDLTDPLLTLDQPLFPLTVQISGKLKAVSTTQEHTRSPQNKEPVLATSEPMPPSQNEEPVLATPEPTLPSQSEEPTSKPRTSNKQSGIKSQPTPRQVLKLSRRASRTYLLVAVILALLVILGGGTLTLTRLFTGDSNTSGTTPIFVQSSLSSKQIDELRHLSTRMNYKQLAGLHIARMSLDEEIGQLIMVEYNDTYYSNDIKSMIKDLHAGGVIMYEFQMQTAPQTKQDIDQMEHDAKVPLLISTDEEGGIVERLNNIYPPRPSALDIYNTGNPQEAEREGKQVALDLLALGINANLAPSVDVALVNGPGQTTRTFGYSADSVIKFAGPYIKAMQQQGVIATIKHFPGLGASTIDPHDGLPVITRTKEQLYQTELAPFKHFIQSKDKLENPGIVMPTDILMTAIDSVYPAELSHIFMTDILRKEFGYDGVALTDALYMKGVTINGTPVNMSQAAVMALQAGNDMLLGPTGYAQTLDMINAIKEALKDGRLSKARLDEAATRIIALKMQAHLMPATPPQN
ncbi:glycoside hydrolase family 3 N-terminal domain-containing protein [Ktedonospora formicarum]|uniref:beta-N-acetylhexosaminidase n=1 Tax=Ktedonospora formicarum TaxID=2778364 RepID=A0A8J3MRR6_9CHLR|nr:glycoside hydrolase family 3 N-terminal domain-containing protein [Ktedonospora formicarum]GHO44081.1 hypothetical protein KSX_22440 [Ktedonospora formicarum]